MTPELERTPMPDVTEEEIQKVLALAEKATPGRWWVGRARDNGDATYIPYLLKYDWDDVPTWLVETSNHPNAENNIEYIAFANPAFVKRLASEFLSLRKSSHSVSQCCPMSERLEKRVDELEAIISKLEKTDDGVPMTPRMIVYVVARDTFADENERYVLECKYMDPTDPEVGCWPYECIEHNCGMEGFTVESKWSTREAAAEASAKGVKS